MLGDIGLHRWVGRPSHRFAAGPSPPLAWRGIYLSIYGEEGPMPSGMGGEVCFNLCEEHTSAPNPVGLIL